MLWARNMSPRLSRTPSSRTASRTRTFSAVHARSEEHTSELQSQSNLVCRLLLENKKRIAQLPAWQGPAPQRRAHGAIHPADRRDGILQGRSARLAFQSVTLNSRSYPLLTTAWPI